MIEMTEQLSEQVSVSRACEVMGVSRSTLYRSRQQARSTGQASLASMSRSSSSRALSDAEKTEVHAILNSKRFAKINSLVPDFAESLNIAIRTKHNGTFPLNWAYLGEIQNNLKAN